MAEPPPTAMTWPVPCRIAPKAESLEMNTTAPPPASRIGPSTAWVQAIAVNRFTSMVRCQTDRSRHHGGGGVGKVLAGATRVGMAPDAGVSVTLPLLVGLRKAMEIILTNPVLTAAEALEIGLITKVVPDGELAAGSLDLARSLAGGATRALGAAKRLVWSGLGARVEAQLPEEARTVAELSGTADALEGLAAVIERRAPVFRGR